MSAIVDLVVVGAGERLLAQFGVWQVKHIISYYLETGGLETLHRQRKQMSNRGVIIDALFGSGPERYGLSQVPVVWAGFEVPSRKILNLSSTDADGEHCLVERSWFTEEFQKLLDKNRGVALAISLADFVRLLDQHPFEDHEHYKEVIAPFNAFLRALDPGVHKIIPVIGSGFAYEISDLHLSRYYPAITRPS